MLDPEGDGDFSPLGPGDEMNRGATTATKRGPTAAAPAGGGGAGDTGKGPPPDAPGSPSTTPETERTSRSSPRPPNDDSANSRNAAGGGGGGGGPSDRRGAVTPELLVDALSGHEDGLLAIAERLMERYDEGYDAMGEAIIDAFADVQKLFQHAVEAAHMEGAAFEASRAREAAAAGGGGGAGAGGAGAGAGAGEDKENEEVIRPDSPTRQQQEALPQSGPNAGAAAAAAGAPGGIPRVEEFVDQDVRDVLQEAVQSAHALRKKKSKQHPLLLPNAKRFDMECYEIYERSCQNASALLPVDSDHRGRLQLAVARAESLSPDRACAILRYAMDDVLRSGDAAAVAAAAAAAAAESEEEVDRRRGDCVLRPPPAAAGGGSAAAGAADPPSPGSLGLPTRSAEEALDSLVAEMREVLGAPVYERTPVQVVARRFWAALAEARRKQSKSEEGLEQKLAGLKGEYLLAKAEWEERLGEAQASADTYRRRCERLQHQGLMGAARDNLSHIRGLGGGGGSAAHGGEGAGASNASGDLTNSDGNAAAGGGGGNPAFVLPRSPGERGVRGNLPGSSAPSVVSHASSFAQHARSLVGSFAACGKYGTTDGHRHKGTTASSPPGSSSLSVGSRNGQR